MQGEGGRKGLLVKEMPYLLTLGLYECYVHLYAGTKSFESFTLRALLTLAQ